MERGLRRSAYAIKVQVSLNAWDRIQQHTNRYRASGSRRSKDSGIQWEIEMPLTEGVGDCWIRRLSLKGRRPVACIAASLPREGGSKEN